MGKMMYWKIFFACLILCQFEVFAFREAKTDQELLCNDEKKCFQALPTGESCDSHNDCAIGCNQKSVMKTCLTKGQLKQVSTGKPQRPCINNPVFNTVTFCGCLPKAKVCGILTKEYWQASKAATGGSCQKDGDCIIACPLSSKRPTCRSKLDKNSSKCDLSTLPIGGLPCSCIPDIKNCGWYLHRSLK